MERIIVKFGSAIWIAFCMVFFFDVQMNEPRFWITTIGLGITLGIKDYYENDDQDDKQ